MEQDNEKDIKKNDKDVLNAGLAGAAFETVQKYGDVAKEHFVAYSGMDNETGTKLVKGLKGIAQEKVNEGYRFQNIHQQAGFSAEVKEVARANAESIINGENIRKIRTDDLGRVNDTLYDTATIDADGNVVAGSETQVKFLGASEKDPGHLGNARRALNKLKSKKFEKYLDADVKIEIPSDQYDQLIAEADKEIKKLNEQLDNRLAAGDTEQVIIKQNEIERLEKIKKNVRKSNVSSEEAVFAREHPGLSTTMDVAKLSHKAGVKTAESAAIIAGSVSIVKNLVSVCKNEITAKDAVKSITKDTATSAVLGYGTGFVGTAIKGAMQNSTSEHIRAISNTNVPATIVSVTVSATKTLSRYFNGEIDGLECLETLGEQGTGMISSAMFTVIGQTVIPVPVVGGLIGGMVGYAFSSATYGILIDSLKEEKNAKEERIIIEKTCNEHIAMIREYRAQMEEIINKYLIESMEVFRESYTGIKQSLEIGDVDLFIQSTNVITETFGGKPAFSNMDDFENKMMAGETFKL